ncbi:aminotransferase class I/II-fold pyridoxal phosphate-dependent enzyme [Granulicoccus sp. GXG6511]|uniref:aminotransferase class I/II-fold pyridoxal phosphate-dependent enzyme n=1 Tax=Granulicoccus sp. GXG6511 TaxID=3381351 RepID=UPI003D7E5A34
MTDTPLVERLRGFTTTIFSEMSQLATQHDAINLGQGFPDTAGPQEVLDEAVRALRAGRNQYPPGHGIPELRRAIAEHQRTFYDLELDPLREVMVSAGATEAMSAAILALCEVGAEVVALEPSYDCYAGAVAMAGGRFRQVRLHEPTYSLDLAELEAALTPRTRIIIVNSPHNPTGHVLTRDELHGIAELASRHDLIVLTDEVYEHMVFDDHRHIPIATLPGMFDRTVTISSAGKTFSVTGWKIGWLTAPAKFIDAIHTTKQNMTYANGTPFQHGVTAGLGLPPERFRAIGIGYQRLRDILAEGLTEAGFDVHPVGGTFFMMADISPLNFDGDGYEFCRRLPEWTGVAAIPAQVFYGEPQTARNLVRFCFGKRPEVLAEAAARLARICRA